MANLLKKLQGMKSTQMAPRPMHHHAGKGTRARLNTAAERMMFGARRSK